MKKGKPQRGKENYSYEEDILSVVPLKRKYDASFQIGDIVFDVDKDKKIVGIELFDASTIFGIPKIFLRNMIEGKLDIEVTDSFIKVQIQFKTRVRNADKSSSLSIERIKPDFLKPTELSVAVA